MNQEFPSWIPATPVAIPLFLITAISLLWGLQTPPGHQDTGNRSASEKTASIDTDVTTTLSDIASIRSTRWDDPFRSIDHAEKALARQEQASLVYRPALEHTDDLRTLLRGTVTASHGDKPSLLVMPVMVDGGETRRTPRINTRHVVETSLASHGFKMLFRDVMSYTMCKGISTRLPNTTKSNRNIIVPVKLYKDDNDRHVFVLWLDQSLMGNAPLDVIRQVLTKMFTKENYPRTMTGCDKESHLGCLRCNAHLSIIGPYWSDTLKLMLEECHNQPVEPADVRKGRTAGAWDNSRSNQPDAAQAPNLADAFHWRYGTSIHSCRSTVAVEDMGFPNGRHLLQTTNNGQKKRPVLRLRHFIGTNESLVEELQREMLRRGLVSIDTTLQRDVVLFYEQDRLYTQSLRDLITRKFGLASHENVISIPFMPELYKGAAGDSDEEKGLTNGDGVIDYFKRTITEIEHSNGRSGFDTSKVGLVGVLAGDPRDAGAIVRSVRPLFPNASWFLFDRDVRFEQSADRASARNAILSSHYALRIDGDFLPPVATFRESYQVAQHIGIGVALKAFQTGRSDDDYYVLPGTKQDLFDLWGRYLPPPEVRVEPLRPVSIELGLRGEDVYAIAADPSRHPIRHPTRDFGRTELKNTVLLGFSGVVFAIIASLTFRPYAGRLRSLADDYRDSFGSLRGIVLGRRESAQSIAARGGTGRRVSEQLFRSLPAASLIFFVVVFLILLCFIWYEDGRVGGEPFAWFSGTSIWPSVFLFFTIIAIAGPMAGRNVWLGSDVLYRPESDRLLRELGTSLKVETSWVRSLSIAFLLTLALIKFAWLGGDYGYVPARSLVARIVGWTVQFLACISLFALVSVTATQALAARSLIRRRGEELAKRIQRLRDTPASPPSVALVEQGVGYFHWVEGLTEQMSRRFLAPSIFLLLFVIARLPLWDDWHINHSLVGLLVVPLILAIACGYSLRLSARGERDRLTAALDSQIPRGDEFAASAAPEVGTAGQSDPFQTRGERPDGPRIATRQQLEWFRALLAGSGRGAFGSPFRDPLLGSFVFIVTAAITESGHSWMHPLVRVLI